jgi:FkbM family methyltransferase
VPFEGGFRYIGQANEYIDWCVFFHDAYEREMLGVLARAADRIPGCVFLDVGANVGHHSLYMASHCSRVHAVEPYPPLWLKIEEKIRHNGLRNLTLHCLAFGDIDGHFLYQPAGNSNTGSGSFAHVGTSTSGREAILLPVRRGDEVLEAAGVARVHILKVDVEGFEVQVLGGLHRTVERNRPLIAIEISRESRHMVPTCFPPAYRFFFLRRESLWRYCYALAPLSSSAWYRGAANIIAIPEEHLAFLNDSSVSEASWPSTPPVPGSCRGLSKREHGSACSTYRSDRYHCQPGFLSRSNSNEREAWCSLYN